jgi:nitroreductase
MTDTWTEQWATAIEEFPIDGSRHQQLHGLIQYGILAPSSHNSQPWRFRLVDESLEVRVDQRRLLPVSDPTGREVRIACGAAIGNMEIAARHFGLRLSVEPLPDPIDRDLLARLRIVGSVDPTPADHDMFEAIPQRHTVRRPFEATPVPDGLKADLIETAARAGTWLEFIDDQQDRQELAELITKADRMQMVDPAFRRELAQWLRPARNRASDGMPGHAFGLNAVASAVAPLVVRTFDMGDGRAAYHHSLVAGSPALAVLGTAHDRPQMWLDSGRALARILLTATYHGVRSSYLNQPIEVGLLRNRVRGLLVAEGHPQLILRLGYGPAGRPTPRRTVEEVLE